MWSPTAWMPPVRRSGAATPRSSRAGRASCRCSISACCGRRSWSTSTASRTSRIVREDERAIRIGALTRHHQLETSPVIARHFPVLDRSDAARRASGDPQPRHHRRQPVACRSGRRAADDGDAARCRAARRLGVGNADGRGARLLPGCAVRRASPRTRSSPRSCCRSFRPTPAGGSRRVARRSGDFALAAVAVTLTLVRRRDRAGAYRRDRRRAYAAARQRSGRDADRHAPRRRHQRRRGRSRPRGRRARDRPARLGRLPPSPGRRARAPRARCRMAARRMSTRDVTVTVNGTAHRHAVEPRLLLSDFLRHDAGPDRHACRLRARRVRRLHHPARRRQRARLPDVRRAGRRLPDRHRRGTRRRSASSTRCRKPSTRITRCNAASARPAC